MDSDEEYVYSDGDYDGNEGNEGFNYSYSDDMDAVGTSGAREKKSNPDFFSMAREDDVRIIDSLELRRLMEEVVSEISSVTSLPGSSATALLRFFRWNKEKLFDKYYSDPDSVFGQVGDLSEEAKRGCTNDGGAVDLPDLLRCDGAETRLCVGVRPFLLPGVLFLSKEALTKYQQFSLDSFVDINRTLRWCPGAGCPKAVKAPVQAAHVQCTCGCAFCFKCAEESHAPAACKELARWKEKCQNESETANWILANTKRCPKCSTRIEKNQGCNHMTCRQCKEEFCWICMGPWSEHGANTGGYYKCNRFESKASPEDNDAARAKAELDRYLHYYQRYHGHHQAQKYAEKQQAATEQRMVELQEASEGSTWIDVQFLKNATDQLIECRRALKYTYVYGYYLPDSSPHKSLFEDHQENLEKFTEHLSGLSEMSFDRMERTEVINYTRVTGKFLNTILKSVQEGVGDDGSMDESKG
eukprot:CAMPEP_0117848098 /NCGR_PEP_ID=MMETSP0949-20121206/20196_1 /TAXON_ID=44440 /ORGANISM="Chattonella subsalsa, Strain CCMP2191" /LENGTH=470 /DNA_ID=CAMNT_0005694849 /DNA_START=125 /DNA_END=1536 /DNA_ORIENTATION=-